jgi:GNAT superfamily N-acetyltransferase
MNDGPTNGVRWLTSWTEAAGMPVAAGAESPGVETLAHQRPSVHGVVLARERVVARCSVWTDGVIALAGRPAGVIGHFVAAAEARSAVRELLEAAVARVHAAGLTCAIGPMDGNTWRRHRFITERGTEPLFFLEADNADEWPEWWGAAGFAPVANYFSAMMADLALEDARVPRAAERLRAEGVMVRQLQPQRFEAELRAIHALSLQAFTRNFLYTPIGAEEFVAQYRAVERLVNPEFVWLAERAGALVGFVFAVPDHAQAARGEPVTTLIAKTLAVLPDRRFAGLGAVLLSMVQTAARRAGYQRIIHAYMHESNQSLNLSARSAQVFRRYTLLAHGPGP